MFKNKKIILILSIAILNAAGLTIVIPLFPFLIGHYVATENIALYLGLLISIYAVCKFLMAPIMGAMSDYFGRKPILLISLIGTAIGYFTLGIAGALWVLFVGRIIDGVCAGDISTLYAYVADSTQGQERTKFYGYLGAANGIGFMVGPAIGGLLGTKYLTLPFFMAAAISVATALLVYFALPETLSKPKRATKISFNSFNTFAHFKEIFGLKTARAALVTGAFFFIALIFYQSNISVYLKNVFNWGPALIGILFALIGLCDIVSRALLLPKLLAFSEYRIGCIGLGFIIFGFVALAIGGYCRMISMLWSAIIIITIGEGLFDPPYNNILSQSVPDDKQGQLQGVNQSLMSLYQIVAPVAAGMLYLSHPIAVYSLAAVLMLISLLHFSTIKK